LWSFLHCITRHNYMVGVEVNQYLNRSRGCFPNYIFSSFQGQPVYSICQKPGKYGFHNGFIINQAFPRRFYIGMRERDNTFTPKGNTRAIKGARGVGNFELTASQFHFHFLIYNTAGRYSLIILAKIQVCNTASII
jgi:hypothetical protein